MNITVILGINWGFYGNDGKENGNYCNGSYRVYGLGSLGLDEVGLFSWGPYQPPSNKMLYLTDVRLST